MSNYDIITMNILTQAFSKHYDISNDDAQNISSLLLNIFGFENRIIDNILTPEMRRLFYLLQEEHILRTHHERGLLPCSKMWDIYYWSLRKEVIFQYAYGKNACNTFALIPKKTQEKKSVYDLLPDEVWYTRKHFLTIS